VAAGFDGEHTARELRTSNYENQRKMVQKRQGHKGEREAEVDGGRVAAKLKARVVEPGWWLAAPLDGHAASGAPQIGGAPQIDWALVQVRRFVACKRHEPSSVSLLDQGTEGVVLKLK
jgi:hypothetical protein